MQIKSFLTLKTLERLSKNKDSAKVTAVTIVKRRVERILDNLESVKRKDNNFFGFKALINAYEKMKRKKR
jgi:hypothetical protein